MPLYRSRGMLVRMFFVCLAVAVVVTIMYGGLTSATVFGVYNANWEGTSDLRGLAAEDAAETHTIQTADEYASLDPSSTVSFVFSPDARYTDREISEMSGFVRNGGTLVIAEDYGNVSNRLLSRLGAKARFIGEPIRDERYYSRSPAMPRARDISDHKYTAGIDALVLNHGTAISPNGATVLVNTSSFAYMDRNRNERLDSGERLGDYSVVTREQFGEGEIVAVGDPSLFINAMLNQAGNRRFARNLIASHRVVAFDVSHLAGLPPLIAARMLLRDSTIAQVTVGLALVVVTSYLGTLVRLRTLVRIRSSGLPDKSPNVDVDTIEAWIRDHHPEWKSERVRRVAEEICRQKQNKEENG